MESSRLPNKQGTRRYPCRRVEVSSSGLIPGSHEREPALDVRSYSTFRRCSLQFKRGSTIIGGIPFDIKCFAFVTRSSPQLPATEEERVARSFSSFSPLLLLNPSLLSLFSVFSFHSPSLLFFLCFLFLFLLLFFFLLLPCRTSSRGKKARRGYARPSYWTAFVLRECFSLHATRIYGTMQRRQLNTCSRASAWQYPRKRGTSHAPRPDVHMYARIWRWSPVTHQRPGSCTTPRVPHNLARHNAARNASNQESHWRHRSIRRAQKHGAAAHSSNYVANTSGVNLRFFFFSFYAVFAKGNAVAFNWWVGVCVVSVLWMRVAKREREGESENL